MPKEISIQTRIQVYESLSDLPAADQGLVIAARTSAEVAYAPYSGFHVGAAALLENGEIILGNNQENAAFPATICGERVALFAAAAQFPDVKITDMAIFAGSEAFVPDQPATPCGTCRQVLAEYEMRFETKIRLILAGYSGPVHTLSSAGELLPAGFRADQLKRQ